MSLGEIIRYLVTWGIVGAILFSLFVILVFRSGLVYDTRNEDGLLKDKIPLRGYLTTGLFVLTIVGFLLLADYFGLVRQNIQLGFGALFLLNMGLYLILFFFDTIVVDGLVLGYWRPAFLLLPEAMGWDSMKVHIIKSLPVGALFGLMFALVSTLITYYVAV
jgi:hypothetical protein